jgi:hypothetical protein
MTAKDPELPLWAVSLGLFALAALFCLPVLASGAAFGIDDWDQQLFYAEAARRTLVHYGQVPLWNPWYCGGSPLLANPSSTFLNPLFALSLLFGVVTGAKLQIALHQGLAMVGAYLFARRLGARGASALIAGVVFGLSGVYTLHLATGHTNWFALAYLPFAALFTSGAIDDATEGKLASAARQALGAGLATSLLLFCGNAYFFVYQCLFALGYGVLAALGARPLRCVWRPIAAGVAVALSMFALAAIKLVPMIGFLQSVKRYDARDESGASISLLWSALVDRNPSLTAFQLPGMQWRWWEYGAYVGLVPLALALIGAAVARARAWRLSCVALFFLLLSMGNGSLVWPLLRGLRGFEGLRVPARAIAYVVLAVACLAALGASWIAERLRARFGHPRLVEVAVALGAMALAGNAFLVTRPALAAAFVLSPESAADTPQAAFHQTRGRIVFHTYERYTDLLDHALRNEGDLSCYDRLHLPIAARASADPKYRGEVWVDGAEGAARLTAFSPNRVAVEIDAARGGFLALNQNFDAAWRVSVNDRGAQVVSRDGLIGVALPSDGSPTQIVFDYSPPTWGAWLSALFALLSLAWLVSRVVVKAR